MERDHAREIRRLLASDTLDELRVVGLLHGIKAGKQVAGVLLQGRAQLRDAPAVWAAPAHWRRRDESVKQHAPRRVQRSKIREEFGAAAQALVLGDEAADLGSGGEFPLEPASGRA